MYKELVERLQKMYTLCAWDELKDASDAIEKLLSENIQLKRRIVFWDKNTFGKLRAELDHLRHERDQAVEELHRNTDAVPVVRCKDCKHSFERSERKPFGCYLHGKNGITLHDGDDFCSYGERKESNE